VKRPLDNQIALVTGATGGIGRAISASLARAGASVHLLARDLQRLEAAAQSIEGPSGIELHVADLTRSGDIEQLASSLAATQGLDILVHCAGSIHHGRVSDLPIAVLDDLYAANVRGPIQLTQCLLPLLKRRRGQIVFVNSSAGLSTRPDSGFFSATQHALRALTDALRQEINEDGIRVLQLYPGRTATERIAALFSKEERPYDPTVLLQPEDIAEVVLHTLSLPRTAEVTDIMLRPLTKSY
jgi:NADP-dependent 3-hydroxy acid dehydrogenase YdfG